MTDLMWERYDAMIELVRAGYPTQRAASLNGIKPDLDETGYDDDYAELMSLLESDPFSDVDLDEVLGSGSFDDLDNLKDVEEDEDVDDVEEDIEEEELADLE